MNEPVANKCIVRSAHMGNRCVLQTIQTFAIKFINKNWQHGVPSMCRFVPFTLWFSLHTFMFILRDMAYALAYLIVFRLLLLRFFHLSFTFLLQFVDTRFELIFYSEKNAKKNINIFACKTSNRMKLKEERQHNHRHKRIRYAITLTLF